MWFETPNHGHETIGRMSTTIYPMKLELDRHTRTCNPSPRAPLSEGNEPIRQKNRLASSNSSVAISENAFVASDDHIRLMVSDLVPLSPTSENQVTSRVSTRAKDIIQKNVRWASTQRDTVFRCFLPSTSWILVSTNR